MFNRSLFDKTNFDRVSNPETTYLYANLYSTGGINVIPKISIPIPEQDIGSDGGFDIIPAWIIPVTPPELGADGGLEIPLVLVIEMQIRIGGDANMTVFPVGNLDISVIELENISLGPLETVTIDTDLMVVLFGMEHDVSSLTLDSEFFQLGIGANQLSFIWEYEDGILPDPLPENELEATIIWENRYL